LAVQVVLELVLEVLATIAVKRRIVAAPYWCLKIYGLLIGCPKIKLRKDIHDF
jgi:hypothetical protein